MKTDATIWDVVVIGGGPAGMMAAGRAAERGGKILLLEKNTSLGKKLLITGGGRCNVTNAEMNTRVLLSKFKDNDKFLFSPFSKYGVAETLEFFHSRGMATKVEALKRAFPQSNSAQSVWDVLVAYMKFGGITIKSNSPIDSMQSNGDSIISVRTKSNEEIFARQFILATGGKSRPETGSTGDGFTFLKSLGHTVSEPEASLVPLEIKDSWVKKLQGITLPEVKITILQNNEKQGSKIGKVLFTHFGITGPTILNMSKDIGELLKYGEVIISLDILPRLDHGMVNSKLQEIFTTEANKKLKNSLGSVVPSALVPILIDRLGINPDDKCNRVSRVQRLHLIELLKNLSMEVVKLLGVEKAVITSGGVALDEIDFKTMQSKLFPNLWIIGDLLNIDRPSGGYSLQLCWTTGYVAGDSVTLST